MSVIYKPTGMAREYSPYALNIYIGCSHRCRYCYAPHTLQKKGEDIYAHLDYSSKIASANVISGVLDFENNSNLSDKEVLENEIAELEKQLKEKKKLRKTQGFEM